MCSNKITRRDVIDGLINNDFSNNYQPIYSVNNNLLNGVEVLLRFNSPSLGYVSPEVFINFAEEENLINDLFFFSTNQALIDLKNNHELKKISINISPSTLNLPDLYCWLHDQCKDNFISNDSVTLEITENIEYLETEVFLENIKKLRMLGFGLSIDDFGTGYASLSRLKAIPFTELKIDKTFIKNFKSNSIDKKIIEHLVSLTHSLGLTVVAEGIEDAETYNMMKEIGVDLCQGYFFHRPMTIYNLINNVIGCLLYTSDAAD
ncbi:EAL domain-containing protein, partial [Photobacterium phosphoreum]|uniref:EAL domain-containing protein n=1 Tax=Photobacterium phosphoreum TaxID=659 RepID=UPI000D4C3D5F